MTHVAWNAEAEPEPQLEGLLEAARETGLLVVRFAACGRSARSLPWSTLEPWTRTRAVTVADVAGDVAGAALGIALCADLVVLRSDAGLVLPEVTASPPADLLWAAGRAGPRALRRCLLGDGRIDADEAADLALAHDVIGPDDGLPLGGRLSVAALTAARDLVRARVSGTAAMQLELATFRFLFAVGDPREGAAAFLEKREPDFGE